MATPGSAQRDPARQRRSSATLQRATLACGRHTPIATKRLTATSETADFVATTPWMPAIGIDAVTAVLKNKAVVGSDFESSPAIPVAAERTDNPGAWAASGTCEADAGEHCDDKEDVSSTTGSAMFVRFGIAYKLTASGAQSSADVSLQLSFNAGGQIVGNAAQQVLALDTSTVQVMPITGWIPSIYAAKVKAAIIATEANSNLQWTFAFQTADTTVDVPNSWDTTNQTAQTGSGEYCTQDRTVAYGGNQAGVRFGILYTSVNSASNQQGYLSALVAVRCS